MYRVYAISERELFQYFFVFYEGKRHEQSKHTWLAIANCIALIRTQIAMILVSIFFYFAQQDIRFIEQIIVSDLFLGTHAKILSPPLDPPDNEKTDKRPIY